MIILESPLIIRRRGVEKRLVLTYGNDKLREPNAALVDLVLRANAWLATLTDGSGKTMSDIARDNAISLTEVSRLMPFAFLAPSIIDAILTGTQPVELTAKRLSRTSDLPLSWAEQSAILGI